jgi:hypothetical protein
VKLSMRLRRMRRRVLVGLSPKPNFVVRSLANRGVLLASCLRRFAVYMGRIALASGGGPSFNKLGPRGCQSWRPTFDG